MSKQHGARQQKKLAKQKAKKESRRKELARQSSPDPNVRLKMADAWPVLICMVPQSLWKSGMGNLLIARRTHDGQVAFGMFLVDAFSLGVKGVIWKIVSPGEFDGIREDYDAQNGPFNLPSPEYFAKLIYCAADFGQSLGFPPHHDFRYAQRLLAGIDPSQCPDEFEFGMNGKPVYMPGPYDTPERINFIMAKLADWDDANGRTARMLSSPELRNVLDNVADEKEKMS